jgi:hypothetical protein
VQPAGEGDDLPGAAAYLTAAITADQTRLPMIHVLEARLLQVNLNYRAGYWDQAAADGERLITLIDDLDQGWLLRRAHLAAVYSAAGRSHWQAASSHADAAAAFDASLAHLDGLGMPLEEAMTRLERGRLLRRAGQRRAAAGDIGTARLMFAIMARLDLDSRNQIADALGAPSAAAAPAQSPAADRPGG